MSEKCTVCYSKRKKQRCGCVLDPGAQEIKVLKSKWRTGDINKARVTCCQRSHNKKQGLKFGSILICEIVGIFTVLGMGWRRMRS